MRIYDVTNDLTRRLVGNNDMSHPRYEPHDGTGVLPHRVRMPGYLQQMHYVASDGRRADPEAWRILGEGLRDD